MDERATPELLLTARQFAEKHRVCCKTIYRHVENGDLIPAMRVGRALLFSPRTQVVFPGSGRRAEPVSRMSKAEEYEQASIRG